MATDLATGTVVDSNVLLDVLTDDPAWGEWSAGQLEQCAQDGPLLINQVVYAEVSVDVPRNEDMAVLLPPGTFLRSEIPWEAAFLAGKSHRDYRRRGGARTTTLPAFFIGAHAAVFGLRLLTRDAARHRTYFPTVELIAPDGAG